MIRITFTPLRKTLLITKKLSNMVITDSPMELSCIIVSYLLYLYTKQNVYLYYGVPAICILHCFNKAKHLYWSLFIYAFFLTCALNAIFPETLFCVSLLTALTCICLTSRKHISIRIYQLTKHIFIAFYFTAFILLTLVFLFIIASAILVQPELLKQLLSHSCVLVFSVILPALFFATDNRRQNETPNIPKPFGWIQLIVTETSVQAATFYLIMCIIQMALYSLTPRPYVIYIVLAVIIAIETSAKLHECSPKNWNNLFYTHRNLLYMPLILLGIASLFIEISLVGLKPRTIAASILLIWITIICIARLVHCRSITMHERPISLYTSIILTIIVSLLTITQ